MKSILNKIDFSDESDKSANSQRKEKMKHDYLLQFFEYDHLPADLQEIGRLFFELAQSLKRELPSNPERTVCFQKLLEAKYGAYRARLLKENEDFD
jgi:hypothetical protein